MQQGVQTVATSNIHLHGALHVASTCIRCCMLLGVVAQKFEISHTFSYVQRDAAAPNIVGPTVLGVVTSVCV